MSHDKEFKLKILEKTEAQIETEILGYLVQILHLYAWKQPNGGYYDSKIKRFRRQASPFAKKGVADILLCYKGYLVCFEVKSAKGVQSKDQKLFQEDIQKAGGFYFVVRSLADALWALHSVEEKLHSHKASPPEPSST